MRAGTWIRVWDGLGIQTAISKRVKGSILVNSHGPAMDGGMVDEPSAVARVERLLDEVLGGLDLAGPELGELHVGLAWLANQYQHGGAGVFDAGALAEAVVAVHELEPFPAVGRVHDADDTWLAGARLDNRVH